MAAWTLIRAGPAVAHCLVDQRQPFGDHGAVPQAPVLVFQQDDVARRVETRVRTRGLQQHQRRQSHDLRLSRIHTQQQARQADRLVAERRPVRNRVARPPNSPR